ncbi:MAG: O-antigen ligase family protein [Bacilli bacterium]
MNKIKWNIIIGIVLSAIILDLDRLALYMPIGRVVIFDILTILFVSISLLKIKVFKNNHTLNIYFILMLLLIVYQIISGFILYQTKINVSYTNIIAVSIKYLLYLLYTFFVTNYLIDKGYICKYINIWIYSSIVVIIVGISQILAINNIPFFTRYFLWKNIRGGGHRIAATFRWQGVLVFYLCIVAPLILGKILDNKKAIFNKRYKDMVLIILIILVGLYSGSRSVYIVLISMLLMILLKPFIKDSFKLSFNKLITIGLFIGSIYHLFTKIIIKSKAVKRIFGLEGAVGVTTGISPRLRIIYASISVWENSPFLGIGSGNLSNIISIASHNAYLEILVENGILGLTIYILIIIIFLKIIFFYFIVSINKKEMFPTAIALSLINILLYQFTASSIQYRLFWAYLPILFAYHFIYNCEIKDIYI